jgi:hypothetical protein
MQRQLTERGTTFLTLFENVNKRAALLAFANAHVARV